MSTIRIPSHSCLFNAIPKVLFLGTKISLGKEVKREEKVNLAGKINQWGCTLSRLTQTDSQNV